MFCSNHCCESYPVDTYIDQRDIDKFFEAKARVVEMRTFLSIGIACERLKTQKSEY